jgi:beta-barrel assembly-enhancing protease
MAQLIPRLLLAVLFLSPSLEAGSIDLPSLGDSSSGLISMEQEFILGRTWLRNLRQQAKTINDPIVTEYTENLVYKLASHSEVKDRRFEIVILDNPELNAFAVPGGVIGINAGLFLNAENEDEFAAVLAHELAHLSQRHFARQVEESRKQAPLAMATLLGSILLLATNNTEAGFAGLMTSQAAATQSALSYSRDWEREADRIGMHTLEGAGFDPNGMPDMFQLMFAATKYSERPPEFLSTHPVTEARIADAAARVDTLPKVSREPDMEYALVRTRLQRLYSKESHSKSHFETLLAQAVNPQQKAVAKYGLALTLIEEADYVKAEQLARDLKKTDNNRITYNLLLAETNLRQEKNNEALDILHEQISQNPENLPITLAYSDVLIQQKKFIEAESLIQRLTLNRKTNPDLWLRLADVEAKTGNTLGIHQARAEYFFLTGYKEKALMQLKIAQKYAVNNYLMQAKLEQRAKEIAASNENLDF